MPGNNSKPKIFNLKVIMWLVGILVTVVIAVFGGVYFVDDRYFKTVEAAELSKTITTKIDNDLSKTELVVAGALQRIMVEQRTIRLDDLYRRSILYKDLIQKDPNNEFFREEYNRILKDIENVKEALTKTRSITVD